MNVKVPMIEVGIASAAMKVTRRLRMNRKTTTLASRPPRIRCSLMSSNDRRMKRDWSLPMLIWMSCGSCGLDPLQPLQDAVDDLDGVGARLLADLDADRRRAAQPRRAPHFLHAVLDAADVGERDHRAVGAVGDDDAVEVLDVLDAAHRADRDLGRPGGELAARNLDVLPLRPRCAPGRPSGRRRSADRR